MQVSCLVLPFAEREWLRYLAQAEHTVSTTVYLEGADVAQTNPFSIWYQQRKIALKERNREDLSESEA